MDNKEIRNTEIGVGENMKLMGDEPKCFSIMVPINGHPAEGDIRCDKEFTSEDLLQAAYVIELTVYQTLLNKGLPKEKIVEYIHTTNHFRREYLGYSMGGLVEDKDIMDAIMDVELMKAYEDKYGDKVEDNEPKQVDIKITKKKKGGK